MARKLPRTLGFTLIELLLVVAIIALLISILLPALGKARQSARTAQCISNLGQYGRGMANYATDARGSIMQLSWNELTQSSQWPVLNQHGGNVTTAMANQVNDIVRRFYDSAFNPYTALNMNRNFGYLAGVDGGYFGNDKLPVPGIICPEDRNALVWAKNHAALTKAPSSEADAIVSTAPLPANVRGATGGDVAQAPRIMPFWSTYQMIPNAWSPEKVPPNKDVLYQYQLAAPGGYDLYPSGPRFVTQVRRMDVVSFPAQKVVLFDLFDRHHAKRGMFHAAKRAKQPLLFFDGSAVTRKTADSNEGWDPRNPTFPGPTLYTYEPDPLSGDPPTSNGAASEQVRGHYRWTRDGLRGVDFAGKSNP